MKFQFIDDMPLSDTALKLMWIPWFGQSGDDHSDYVSTRMITAFDHILPYYKSGKLTQKQATAYMNIMEQIYTKMFHDRAITLPSTVPLTSYVLAVMDMVYAGTPENTFMELLNASVGNGFDYLVNIFVEAFTNTHTNKHQFNLDHNYIPHITATWQIMSVGDA